MWFVYVKIYLMNLPSSNTGRLYSIDEEAAETTALHDM